jgi:hypothetical protein
MDGNIFETFYKALPDKSQVEDLQASAEHFFTRAGLAAMKTQESLIEVWQTNAVQDSLAGAALYAEGYVEYLGHASPSLESLPELGPCLIGIALVLWLIVRRRRMCGLLMLAWTVWLVSQAAVVNGFFEAFSIVERRFFHALEVTDSFNRQICILLKAWMDLLMPYFGDSCQWSLIMLKRMRVGHHTLIILRMFSLQQYLIFFIACVFCIAVRRLLRSRRDTQARQKDGRCSSICWRIFRILSFLVCAPCAWYISGHFSESWIIFAAQLQVTWVPTLYSMLEIRCVPTKPTTPQSNSEEWREYRKSLDRHRLWIAWWSIWPSLMVMEWAVSTLPEVVPSTYRDWCDQIVLRRLFLIFVLWLQRWNGSTYLLACQSHVLGLLKKCVAPLAKYARLDYWMKPLSVGDQLQLARQALVGPGDAETDAGGKSGKSWLSRMIGIVTGAFKLSRWLFKPFQFIARFSPSFKAGAVIAFVVLFILGTLCLAIWRLGYYIVYRALSIGASVVKMPIYLFVLVQANGIHSSDDLNLGDCRKVLSFYALLNIYEAAKALPFVGAFLGFPGCDVVALMLFQMYGDWVLPSISRRCATTVSKCLPQSPAIYNFSPKSLFRRRVQALEDGEAQGRRPALQDEPELAAVPQQLPEPPEAQQDADTAVPADMLSGDTGGEPRAEIPANDEDTSLVARSETGGTESPSVQGVADAADGVSQSVADATDGNEDPNGDMASKRKDGKKKSSRKA